MIQPIIGEVLIDNVLVTETRETVVMIDETEITGNENVNVKEIEKEIEIVDVVEDSCKTHPLSIHNICAFYTLTDGYH